MIETGRFPNPNLPHRGRGDRRSGGASRSESHPPIAAGGSYTIIYGRGVLRARAVRGLHAFFRMLSPATPLFSQGCALPASPVGKLQTVEKPLTGFSDKFLQSAARTPCSPMANNSHTCSLRCISCQVHAPTENDLILFVGLRRQTLRGFFKIPLQILSPADIINITFERGRGHGG